MKIKLENRLIDVVVCDLLLNGINEGKVICDWEVLTMLMDDDLRNQLHDEFTSVSNEEFLKQYLKLDSEFINVIKQNALSINVGDVLYLIEIGKVDSSGGLNSTSDEDWLNRIYYIDLEMAMKDFASIELEDDNYKAIIAYKFTNDDSSEYDFGLIYDGEIEVSYGKKAKKYIYGVYQEEINSFSELIREARIKKGLTQKEVAEALGISLHHYQHFEYTDRIPAGQLMIKLVRFFDFDLDVVNEILENQ